MQKSSGALASSHREAPFITKNPKTDATDFYLFKSYEAGRQDYVTIIANYIPFQESYGGPNFFALDPEAIYDINIDNTGDAKEDRVIQVVFNGTGASQTVSVYGPIAPPVVVQHDGGGRCWSDFVLGVAYEGNWRDEMMADFTTS